MSGKKLLVGLCVCTVLILALHGAFFRQYTVDDAFITFKYSKNLTLGRGLVFNQGERVEATSSILWALLLVPFELLITDGAVIGAKILGYFFLLAVALLGALCLNKLRGKTAQGQFLTVLYLFLLAASSPFIFWSLYGMENGLVALLLLLAVYFFMREVERGKGLASAFFVFLLQTARPEGFIFIFVFVFFKIIFYLAQRQKLALPWLLSWLTLLFISLGIYEIWGFIYYGHLLPNTVAVKVDSVTPARIIKGVKYLTNGGLKLYLILAAISFNLIVWQLLLRFFKNRANSPNILTYAATSLHLIFSLVLIGYLFTILVGGDWMVNGRFISHLIPLLLLVFLYSAEKLVNQYLKPLKAYKAKTALIFIFVSACFIFYPLNLELSAKAHKWAVRLDRSCQNAIMGMVAYLNDQEHSENKVVACSDVGMISYYYQGKILDWWGLADEEIALSGQGYGNIKADYLLRRQPDYIILYSAAPTLSEESTQSGYGNKISARFLNNQEFLNTYTQRKALLFNTNRWHLLFERNIGNY